MLAILKECPLFRGLSEDKIEEIIDYKGDYTLAEYRAGDVIARRDTAYSGLMIIVRGKVHGEISYPSGEKAYVDVLEAPQLIAPAFLFGGYNKLPVDVIADADTTIMTLHRGYIFELMQEYTLILSNFIDILSDRANVWSKKMYYFSFRSVKEKAAKYLLDNTTGENPGLVLPDMAEIAEYFAATRSSVLTVLADMEKKKIIKTDGAHITVLNRKSLSDILK